jgi:parallel beta-helix repeat protein
MIVLRMYNVRTVYMRNTIIGNKGSGIFHEAAYGCIIQANYIARNGADGIFISSSSDVQAFDNTVTANRVGGIHLFIDGATGHDLANNYIHDNVIKMREGTFNGITTINVGDPVAYSTSKNNRFRGDSYFVPRLTQRYWYWAGTLRTWRQWQAAGQDRTGRIRRL